MKFSERMGKRAPKSIVQVDSMDYELRNSLWNIVIMHLIVPMERDYTLSSSGFLPIINAIWFSFFKEPLDRIPLTSERVAQDLRERFFRWDYLTVYDFLEFLASYDDRHFNAKNYIEGCNLVLKRELSGYRFIERQLTPITNDHEIQAVETALSATTGKLKGVNIHLESALSKISDRSNPDYRNSIKESISAVESLCQVIAGDKKAELGKTLRLLKEKIPIHGALEQAFIKIYGYTSDGDGIRHALSDQPNLDQEDAIYMFISCSAFINYLLVKSEKGGLLGI